MPRRGKRKSGVEKGTTKSWEAGFDPRFMEVLICVLMVLYGIASVASIVVFAMYGETPAITACRLLRK